MSSLRNCDIIIPVYNALEELMDCVESLEKHTEFIDTRIIIINDCSTDPNVNIYLNTLNKPYFVILRNQANLGFVGTVNRGMSYSNQDVVLLNSDTIVTDRWLSKLKEVAYSDRTIGTVTPLTNNGSICSVPNFLEDNSIPEGYSIDSFGKFIEKISLNRYNEIPTAVGFCMYIKRVAIEEVGLFDSETFGKGYAEENDFCCRIIENGYKNVIDDHTFIYHKGSMSFKGEKLALLRKNLKTLNERYPYYEKSVQEFITKNPLRPIHDNIKLRLSSLKDMDSIKGSVLFVLHNFFDEPFNHPIGGTEYHVKDLVSEIKDTYAFVMVSSGADIVLKQYYNNELIAKYYFPLQDPITLNHFHHKEYSNIVENILDSFDITLIHIHHLIKHSFDIPYLAKKKKINVIFTLHDYYLFCPRVNLLDENNNYCIEIRSENKCTNCLRSAYGMHTTFIKKWKREVEGLLLNVNHFVTPSEFTKQMFENEYPSIRDRVICIPHDVKVPIKQLVQKSRVEDKNYHIGFLGGLSPNKGSDLISKIITKFPKDRVTWHLIGGIGDQRLNLLKQSNVIKHGEYKREELNSILNSINLDFICLLSPWPETFSYTLSEAWINEIPVLVTPMGALKERVKEVNGGWVTDSVSLDDIFKKIECIINLSDEDFQKVRLNISSYNFAKHDMNREYRKLYKQLSNEYKPSNEGGFNNKEIIKAMKYYLPEESKTDSLSDKEYSNQVQKLEDEIMKMKSTIGWKVLNRLRTRNSVSLRFGKKLIFLALKYKK